MTLQELWMIIVRRWKLVVALPVACALVCAGYLLATKFMDEERQYTAKAYVVGNSNVAAVASLANNEALQLYPGEEEPPFTVRASVGSGTLTVTVVATGEDGDTCIELANEIATHANEAAIEFYADYENPYSGIVQEATEYEEVTVTSDDSLKYLLVAVLAGLFVAICVVVVLDMRKRPVKTAEGVQDAVELPVLEILPAVSGERLLANVRFAAGDTAPESVLVVPTGDVETAESACELIESAVRAEGASNKLEVLRAEPLSQGMAGAYASRDVDAVVVTARQWADELPQLESTVAELRLAGAKLVGVVFAKDKLV